MRILFAFMAFSLMAAPAAAQDPRRSEQAQSESVSIVLGETVTLRIDEAAPAGFVLVDRTQTGPFTERELGIAARAMQAGPESMGVNSMRERGDSEEGLSAVEPDIVRIRFGQVPNADQVMLVVLNGYGQAFAYRAIQHTARGESPTDVCWVLPNLRTYELWPYAIESLDLSSIRLYPWTDMEAQPPCQ